MRISEHPILKFRRGHRVRFYFDGQEMKGFEGEPIAAALHAEGVRVLHYSEAGRPRGFFCAIGNCSSCLMMVDSQPNVRTCITPLRAEMDIRTQRGRGVLSGEQSEDRES